MEGVSLTFFGSTYFCSVAMHQQVVVGRKDDLESMLYTLAYLRKLTLPWGISNQIEKIKD
jgi:hypothetical protein